MSNDITPVQAFIERITPSVGIIRSVVWYLWPTFGLGAGMGANHWDVPPYFTIQIMWLNRGLAFDWSLE